jgi:polyisoprenoid-binding protein YceI
MKQIAKMGALGAAGALGLCLLTNSPAPVALAQAPAAAAPAPAPLTGTWTIDPAHTNVHFAIGHLGISTVRGRFGDVSGTIVADAAHPEKSTVAVTIKTASVDTGVAMRDGHLKTADFFDAEKYPEITFKSTRIEKTRRGFVARGDLTLHGVTRAVTLPFRVNGPIVNGRGQSHVGAETSITLNRRDFGMNYGSLLASGALDVANNVDVTISLEAIPMTAAAN